MKELKVGMAKADITPEIGCLLYGYVDVRHAERVLDPLEVKALAISQNEETVLMFSAEICALNLDVCDEIREKISVATGVKKDNILYSCIHTHSGPVTRNSAGWGTADMDYINGTLVPKSIEVASVALSSMLPAAMGVGKTESLAGINRRQITPDGEVILGQNPDAPYDPIMTVVTFKTFEGEPIGTLVHFGAHPTVAGIGLSITRDWPGIMIDRITELTGAPCMYINSAEGNVGPRISNGRTTANESYIPEVGNVAADDAEKAYKSIIEFKVPELKINTSDIELVYAPIPTLADIEKAIEAMGNPDELVLTDITKYSQLQKLKELLELGDEIPSGKKISQTVISIGDVAIVPFPFEVFTDVSVALRQNSPYANTLLFGLTQGSYAYLPTKEQIPYGGYEIGSFRASSVPQFDDNLAEHLLNENVKLLNSLYKK